MRRIAVLLASVLFALTGTAAASAHADLVSMSPAPGSTVSEALQLVTLTFGEDVTAMGSTVVVLDPNGSDVQLGVTIQGPAVTVTIGDLAMAGEYHVNYRVNSVDGHIVEGSEVFTYAGPVVQPTPTAIATIAGGGDDDEGFESEENEGLEGASMVGLGLIAIIVIGGIVYAMTVRKKD